MLKRSVSISGHPTSISVEERFWQCLRAIAERDGLPIARLIARIDADREPGGNLSSAIRLFVLEDALARRAEAPAGAGDTDAST
ncbi:aryl-sulfate sulfotransferase [Jiella endophytica]|uniref:Aryl-sulfate sulfotransferase n=1 Tax=Jiella endophytica TaxID=2558362 RepID=A0A4Y8RJY7_9HYPH|nr:ribbon-helix-helix domain-containing protein [Jiella endophytica]TFF23359.1 aryl-sulfate sulfotransferase [Jiella endophytica]